MKMFFYYITALVSLLVLDGLWLSVVAKNFYKDHLGTLLRGDIVWPVVGLFYVLYAGAVVYFAVMPAEGSWAKALLAGCLLGFTAYMTYDLVNFATLKNWPWSVVLVDIVWGCIITGLSAVVALALNKVK